MNKKIFVIKDFQFDLQRFDSAPSSTNETEAYYIDADGNSVIVENPNYLTAFGAYEAGTYFVKGNVEISGKILFNTGDVNLILMDGCELTITNNNRDNNGNEAIFSYGTLNIYTQSGGTGKLNAKTTWGVGAIYTMKTLNIYGGQVSANGTGHTSIYAVQNVNIYGGQVTAIGSNSGIETNSVLLNWKNDTDYINVSRYQCNNGGKVIIADGKRFYDESGNVYSTGSAIPNGKLSALDGYIITLPDGATIDGATRINETNCYIVKAGANLTISNFASGEISFDSAITNVAKSGDNITVTAGNDSFTISGLTSPPKITWTVDGTTATYNETQTGGATIDGNKIVYQAPAGTNKTFTLSNLASGLTVEKVAAAISVDGTTITINDASILDAGKIVAAPSGYTLALDESVTKPVLMNPAWTVENTNATLKADTSAGYSVENNEIIYSAAKTGEAQIVLGGLIKNSKLNLPVNNILTLEAATLGTKTSIKSNASAYTVNVTGDMSGKTIYGTNGADNVSVAAGNAAVDGRGGNDSLIGGSGNDTLSGGDGNDTLSGNSGNDLFVYNVGEDVIEDYGNGTDKISVDSALTYMDYELEGSDVVLNYGEGNSLTVKNGKDKTITINSVAKVYGDYDTFDGAETEFADYSETEYNETVDGSASGAIEVIGSGGGNTSGGISANEELNSDALDSKSAIGTNGSRRVRNVTSTDNQTVSGVPRQSVDYTTEARQIINAIEYPNTTSRSVTSTSEPVIPNLDFSTMTTQQTVNQRVYAGGNQIISDYQSGEKIYFGADHIGSFYDDAGNYCVGSSTGTLVIQNAVDKVVDLSDAAGNSVIKAYAASTAGVIDGRGLTGFEIINGSAGADSIFAGDGGSQMWGGADVAQDVLIGGGGTDIFIGGRTQGADIFLNASSADIVHLNDASLSDIIATEENNGAIAIAFNTGNVIGVQSSELLSATVMLADGSAYRYNHINKSWQSA